MRKASSSVRIYQMVLTAILLAIITVLHFTGAAIPAFGTKISLVLIPIALGAMLIGPVAGAVLGFFYGLMVFISLGVMHMDPFTGFLFDHSPIMTALICTVKTTAAGFLAGWIYRLLSKKSSLLGVFVAAALVPTVNTGIFVLGCLIISGTIDAYIAHNAMGVSAVYFVIILCAGINYLLELAVNLILAPALERIIRIVGKKLKK